MPVTYQWLTAVGGEFPTPGRTRVTFAEARNLLVAEVAFTTSNTRADLWDGLERYLARFFDLEHRYNALLDGKQLVRCLWLGGSYVSSRVDPSNIDVTVCVNDATRLALKGQPGSKWLSQAFSREERRKEFGVSPLELRYRPVVSVFRSRVTDTEDQQYLQDRGGWDEWWQRCRDSGAQSGGPTLATVEAMRGYLEVTI
ncbi:hypothetical protein ncot_00165 [Nocardioides sp. JQ2195]|uniref:DUF6932 family protein n=1 Tax=Nocardioides sp. JQ2195 TaxID=2592334 RepID=UPI00143E5BFE|nr:hypothetical protein [Nocardioides sp. JQ2195]QIX25173.1 hypothetical protein ncot_00165 [Nocardioides sp. JQ2195]